MKLVPDWKRVLLIGYSAWAFVAAVMAMVVPAVAWKHFAVALNPLFFGWLVVIFCGLGVVGRVIEQQEEGKVKRRLTIMLLVVGLVFAGVKANAMDEVNDGLTPAVAEVMAGVSVSVDADEFDTIAFDLIAQWEGKRNYAYLDIVNVPTICYGHTRTVTQADVANRRYMSDGQCQQLLVAEINEYREQMHRHLTADTLAHRLPVRRDAAFTSLTINIGWGAVGRSTAVRRLNAGDIAGSCTALTWFNKAGGVRVPGLVNRRDAEYTLCIHV